MGIFDLPPQFLIKNSSSIAKPSMSKRKHSDNGQSNMADEPENARTGPVTLVIDPEGDLYMKLDGGSLKVSRKALSLSSPVFLAMLGANSKFKEATDKTLDHDGVQIVSFEEDNFDIMALITRIMHLQSNRVPSKITFNQLYQVAVLCDKYDLNRCLGLYTGAWVRPYFDYYSNQGFEKSLFISVIFRLPSLFKKVTKHLILNSEISEQGTLVTTTGFDVSEGISPIILDRITKSRAETMFLVLDLYWQELRKLRASNTTPVCNVGGVNVAKCDAINLGCLYQQLPDLQDPRESTGACRKTVNSMIEAAGGIQEVCGALVYKFGDHRSCAVGTRLAAEARKVPDAVQGLELKDMVS